MAGSSRQSTSYEAPPQPHARCAWCHERGDHLKQITVTVWDHFVLHRQAHILTVHPAHEEKVRAFATHFRRYGRFFLVSTAAVLLAPFVTSFFFSEAAEDLLGGIFVALLGVTLIAFPFSANVTAEMMGLRSSVRLARVLGMICLLLGALITATALP